MLHRSFLIAALCVLVECVPSRLGIGPRVAPREVFRDSFHDASQVEANWLAVTPKVEGASVQVEESAVRLTMPPGSQGDVSFVHHFDVSDLRGKRVRVTARAKADAESESAARLTVSTKPAQRPASYSDRAQSREVNAATWTNVRAVFDIAPAAATGEISLTLHGPGRAWFEDVAMQIVGDTPANAASQLSRQQLDNVIALTRAVSLVRYRHPADQAADLDWNAFVPAAIDRVLRATDTAALVDELRALFGPIAPTVTFVRHPERVVPLDPPHDSADHLAWWWHRGLGPSTPYSSYREGRGSEDLVTIEEAVTARLAKPADCKLAHVHATVRRPTDTGKPSLFVEFLRPGRQQTDADQAIAVGEHEVTLSKEVPPDTQQIRIGLYAEGRVSVTLSALSLTCDNGARAAIDLGSEAWAAQGWSQLFTWNVAKCGSGTCATLSRNPYDSVFDPNRDVLDEELGNGVRIRVPLAVWADAQRTLPVPAGEPLQGDFAIDDLPTRLAAIAAAWGTLSVFYPSFKDQHIDWPASLPTALVEAAAANSAAGTHAALGHLVAGLHDNHARTFHPAIDRSGLLPLAFRRFGDKIVVIGGLPDHTKVIAPGAEVLSFDGNPALAEYARLEKLVSAATDGWRAYFTEYSLGLGAPGTFRRVRARLPDGTIVDKLLPVVARDLYGGAIRDHRPKTGTEVAPDVRYVDFDTLSATGWNDLLPTLQRARAIIFDFRGYMSSGAFASLANLANETLLAPHMEIPLVGPPGSKRSATQWQIRPAQPHLDTPIVVLIDGQSMSAVETFLQIFHDSRLGYVVGEPSGGTNGNMNAFSVPGGFGIRFTGMRVISADGTSIQGRGIVPDEIVHPTLEGVRAGRDEILEAGIAAAQRLTQQSTTRRGAP